jgi:hypothetical protein
MKIMVNKPHRGRTNFVDENNVVLGWESASICCENHHWAVRTAMTDGQVVVQSQHGNEEVIVDLDGWVFDPTFVKHERWSQEDDVNSTYVVWFKIVNKEGVENFILLQNTQNGYYSHGFKLEVSEWDTPRVIFEGSL